LGFVTSHAKFAYDKAHSKAMGLSPFKVAYGIDPLSSLDLIPGHQIKSLV